MVFQNDYVVRQNQDIHVTATNEIILKSDFSVERGAEASFNIVERTTENTAERTIGSNDRHNTKNKGNGGFIDQHDRIYPNPAKNTIFTKLDSLDVDKIVIINKYKRRYREDSFP